MRAGRVLAAAAAASALVVLVACAPREGEASSTPATALSAPPLTKATPTAAPGMMPIAIVGDRLDLGKDLTFVAGSAELTNDPDNDAIFATIADYVARHPDVDTLRIEVHSDSVGLDEFNLRMSQARADKVAGVLMDRGVASERLHPVGFGETRPIASNATAEGRAKNRRIELRVEELGGAPIAGRPAPP